MRPIFLSMELIIIALIAFLLFLIFKNFKTPKVGSLAMITGGVKAGKSTFAVYTAYREYRGRHFRWRIKKALCKLFRKPLPEEPLLYSNIPLTVSYVPLTKDILERKKRVNYNSVLYVCEGSLVANSMSYKDGELNDRLELFNKLIGHETKGGVLIYDTQCIGDMHYAVKRSVSNYFYIHHLIKWIPFFLVAFVREERYSDDNTTITANMQDDENQLMMVLLPKSTWKKFDCYCYSALTDNLPIEDRLVRTKNLKAKEIVSFRTIKGVNDEKQKNTKNN